MFLIAICIAVPIGSEDTTEDVNLNSTSLSEGKKIDAEFDLKTNQFSLQREIRKGTFAFIFFKSRSINEYIILLQITIKWVLGLLRPSQFL